MTNTTIVIPHVLNWDITKACIDSCIENCSCKNIILLDNSKEPVPEFDYPDGFTFLVYRVYDTDKNMPRSCPNAWNIGVNIATTQYVLILNSDTEVPPQFDKIMLDEFAKHENCYCISVPEVTVKSWKEKGATTVVCDNWSNGLNGVCFMIDKVKCINQFKLNFFDERFIPSCYEDVDFYKNIVDAGGQSIVTAKTAVMHYGAFTRNSREMLEVDHRVNGCYHIQANKKRFADKHNLCPNDVDYWEHKMKEWHRLNYEHIFLKG